MLQSEQSNNQQRVIDLDVDGHLMSLGAGLYCIYHAPNQTAPDEFGFPGVRISLPPFPQANQVSVQTFEKDGWIGGEKNAALVRVSGGPGLILVTVYKNPAHQHPAPKLQVVRLNDAPNIVVNPVMQQQVRSVASVDKPIANSPSSSVQQTASSQHADQKEGFMVIAHVQREGDVIVPAGNWVGQPDSKAWIEGFGLSMEKNIFDPNDIEYQAVLGKGWMSPWYSGNQFCGSRGMALPLLGICIRLKGEAEKKYSLTLTASFIDGTKLATGSSEVLSSPSLAPLESFKLDIVPVYQSSDDSLNEAENEIDIDEDLLEEDEDDTFMVDLPVTDPTSDMIEDNNAAKIPSASQKKSNSKSPTRKNPSGRNKT